MIVQFVRKRHKQKEGLDLLKCQNYLMSVFKGSRLTILQWKDKN